MQSLLKVTLCNEVSSRLCIAWVTDLIRDSWLKTSSCRWGRRRTQKGGWTCPPWWRFSPGSCRGVPFRARWPRSAGSITSSSRFPCRCSGTSITSSPSSSRRCQIPRTRWLYSTSKCWRRSPPPRLVTAPGISHFSNIIRSYITCYQWLHLPPLQAVHALAAEAVQRRQAPSGEQGLLHHPTAVCAAQQRGHLQEHVRASGDGGQPQVRPGDGGDPQHNPPHFQRAVRAPEQAQGSDQQWELSAILLPLPDLVSQSGQHILSHLTTSYLTKSYPDRHPRPMSPGWLLLSRRGHRQTAWGPGQFHRHPCHDRQWYHQEVTVDMLTQLDRLVQLLESPIFTFLRMEVSVQKRKYLRAEVNCQALITIITYMTSDLHNKIIYLVAASGRG